MDSLHPFSTKMMPPLSNNPMGAPGLSPSIRDSSRLVEDSRSHHRERSPRGQGGFQAGARSTRELSVVCICFAVHWREHSHGFLHLEMLWEC